ncbi:hypothetical protein [Propionicicella superfundia]|nr:hypothetical protein [Propionicicella superfundia]
MKRLIGLIAAACPVFAFLPATRARAAITFGAIKADYPHGSSHV